MADDGATRIGTALRAAHIANQALEMMHLEPRMCKLQMLEITESLKELQAFLNGNKLP
jgi:hypothetical protein